MVPPASGGVRTDLERWNAGFAMTGNDSRDQGEKASAAASEDDLSRRLERLGAQLGPRPSASPVVGPKASSGPSPLGSAMRASSEFVAGVIAGCGLGWLIDKGLGTSPWGLIVFLLLGFAAGIYNVMRSSGFLAPSSGRGGSATPRDRSSTARGRKSDVT